MSSYLNFYLIPKTNDKPLLFQSINRSSEVYQAFNDALSIPYSLDELKYRELTVADIDRVLDDVNADIKNIEDRIQRNKEAYNSIQSTTIDQYRDYIDEYISSREYKDELITTRREIQYIRNWVEDIKYSDFDKVVVTCG